MWRIITLLRSLDAIEYVLFALYALALIALYYATEYALTATIG